MKTETPKKTLEFDPERCNDLFTELVEVCKKHNPSVGEILIAYGNLGYTLGASIGGFGKKGPSINELKQLYYQYPNRLDLGLMLQGLTVTTWYGDWEKIQTAQDNNKAGLDNNNNNNA